MSKEKPSTRALISRLGIDLATTGKRASAAIQALSEEILHLQRELDDLQLQLSSAEIEADEDTLVSAFNRRAFERELKREIAVADRYGTPLCVVFLDLDRFKAVNDQFGHPAGDSVLIKVAEILAANTRETDLVGRLGGDEFGIALTHADIHDCTKKAQSLSDQIADLVVRDAADPTIPAVSIGASFGVAEWSRGKSAAALLADADSAMFAMKARHRRLRHQN